MFEFGRKVIGVLEIIVALFFIVNGVRAIVQAPETNRLLREAVVISDGKLDPANEGKTVILIFNMSDVGDARDEDLGLTFPYPSVIRHVDELCCTVSGRKYEWRSVANSEERVGDAHLFGDVSTGDFKVEGSLLRSLGMYRDIGKYDFDADELAAFFAEHPSFSDGYDREDRYYLSNTSYLYFSDYEADKANDYNAGMYDEEVGSIRIRYQGIIAEEYDRIAVVGKQEGNWIVEDDRIDALTAYENVEDAESLIRQSNTSLSIGVIIGMLVCLVVLFFGIKRVFLD